jgi:hypothetical protein
MSWRRFNLLKDGILYRKNTGLFAILSPIVLAKGESTKTASQSTATIKTGTARANMMQMLHLPDA